MEIMTKMKNFLRQLFRLEKYCGKLFAIGTYYNNSKNKGYKPKNTCNIGGTKTSFKGLSGNSHSK